MTPYKRIDQLSGAELQEFVNDIDGWLKRNPRRKFRTKRFVQPSSERARFIREQQTIGYPGDLRVTVNETTGAVLDDLSRIEDYR